MAKLYRTKELNEHWQSGLYLGITIGLLLALVIITIINKMIL